MDYYKSLPPSDIPVLLLGFNRPREMAAVLGKIKGNGINRLFVSLDGPREDNNEDIERVALVRRLISGIDWECHIETLVNERNLGLKKAVSRAIDWFFGQVEFGVILEDDCLPGPDFFRFSSILLQKYKDDERVMTISGNNFHYSAVSTDESYSFSRYPLIWGWATWKRAWERYDYSMTDWPKLRETSWLYDVLHKEKYVRYWKNIFDQTYNERNQSWAYRWIYASWLKGGLTVLPATNLVTNIGFSPEATHTTARTRAAEAPVERLNFPLVHPKEVLADDTIDRDIQEKHFSLSFYQKVRHRLFMAGMIERF